MVLTNTNEEGRHRDEGVLYSCGESEEVHVIELTAPPVVEELPQRQQHHRPTEQHVVPVLPCNVATHSPLMNTLLLP